VSSSQFVSVRCIASEMKLHGIPRCAVNFIAFVIYNV
jgi:hypothetical protein